MNAPTNIQVLNDAAGNPAFVVIPYDDYLKQLTNREELIPHDVVSRAVDGATPVRAWREHLRLTQAEMAARLGISQPAYAQQENSERLRKATREKIAVALGISVFQLSF